MHDTLVRKGSPGPPPFLPLRAFLCVLGLGALSLQAGTPFLFPSLGASAFLLLSAPRAAIAEPRAVVLSHLLAAGAGWGARAACGLDGVSATIVDGGGPEHVLAAALALGATCALMGLARAEHPPAGATTLIVALGFLPQGWHVALVGASAALLVVEVRLLQRLHGEIHPWWSRARPTEPAEAEVREPA